MVSEVAVTCAQQDRDLLLLSKAAEQRHLVTKQQAQLSVCTICCPCSAL